jgi:hypothetical protein
MKSNKQKTNQRLIFDTELRFEKMIVDNAGHVQVCEAQALYEVRSARKTMG